MNRSLVVLEMLRNKSIELQMKSDALLSGYVTEQVALKLAQCDIEHKFLLKNGNDLELSAYKREVYGKLIYAYQKDPDEDFYASVALFFDQKMNRETEDGLIFSWEIKRQTDRVMIRLHARIGDRRVPVHIQVDRTNPQKNPQEINISVKQKIQMIFTTGCQALNWSKDMLLSLNGLIFQISVKNLLKTVRKIVTTVNILMNVHIQKSNANMMKLVI